MSITIYHNPACSTSRKVLGLLRDGGHEPQVIEYLKTPPTRKVLQDLLTKMGLTPRDVLRQRGSLYDELGLAAPGVTDAAILDAIGQHPILMERPILVTEKGVRLCRPVEKMNEIMPG